MTTTTDPTGDGQPSAAPYLPPSQPIATGASLPASAPAVDQSPADAPYVPAPTPVAAPPTEAPVFDAKAMVESQKRVNDNPAYGALPTGTEASKEASKKLRAKAQRKKSRNKAFVRVLGLVLLAGIAAAGWFGYQAYQDEQNAESAVVSDDRDAEEILEDFGSQGQMINAQDALNEAVVPRVGGGGLGGAIDSAREAVGDINGDAAIETGDAPAPTPFTYDVVVPPIVQKIGERFPDATGRETYVVNADEFAQGDPEAFGLWVRLMAIQPQLIPEAEAFVGLPAVAADEIVIAVVRNGDQIEQATVVGESVALRVDVTP